MARSRACGPRSSRPTTRPELKLVGVAAGGIPTDFAHNLEYINGSPDWAGAIPAVGVGLARGSRIDLGSMLSERGREVAAEVQKGCLNPGGFPGLTLEDMLKPEFKDWRNVPALVKAFNESIMGRSGTPDIPLLMAVGNDDGTGDSVMIAKDVQELAHTYCDRGLPVQFSELTGLDHVAALAGFAPQAILFLQSRFADVAPASGCPIPAGNALDPLPKPPGKVALTSGIVVGKLKGKRREALGARARERLGSQRRRGGARREAEGQGEEADEDRRHRAGSSATTASGCSSRSAS